MIDIEVTRVSRWFGTVVPRSKAGQEFLQKVVDVPFCKEFMTTYGNALVIAFNAEVKEGLKAKI